MNAQCTLEAKLTRSFGASEYVLWELHPINNITAGPTSHTTLVRASASCQLANSRATTIRIKYMPN